MELRPHQISAQNGARSAYRRGCRAILICMQTGAGKTLTMVSLLQSALSKGSRCLWLAHRSELVQQAAAAIEHAGGRPGIIAPWAPATDSPIQVASIDTLKARGLRPEADIVVLDEAHHAVAEKNRDVLDHYRAKKALLFGLTATPQRDDGVALGNVFDALVPPPTHTELTASGYLVPARVFGPGAKSKTLAEDPVQATLTYAPSRRTIVFASSIKAGKDLVHRYASFGIGAAWVDGTTKDADRAKAVEQYKSGQLQVLVNFLILTEGFDCPETSCVILGRNVASLVAYLQATGRGLRAAPWVDKKDCLMLDLCGSSHEHGLPDEPRDYSLDGLGIKTGEKVDPVRQCPSCGRVVRAGLYVDSTCPECGYVIPARPDPAVRREKIGQICESHPDTRRTEKLRELCQIAKKKGYKIGWALMQYKVRYGSWPTDEIKQNAGFFAFRRSA